MSDHTSRSPRWARADRRLISAAILAIASLLAAGPSPSSGEEPDAEPHPYAILDGPMSYVGYLAFTHDGRTLIAGCSGSIGELIFWDAETLRVRRILRTHYYDSLALAPDGGALAVGYANETVRLVDVPTGRELSYWRGQRPKLGTKIRGVEIAFSPDGKELAVASVADKVIRIWDVAEGRKLRTFKDTGKVGCIAYSPDGKSLALATGDQRGWPKTIKILDAATGRVLLDRKERERIALLALSPDGRTLAWSSFGGDVPLIDLATGRTPTILANSGGASHPTYSPDGSILAVSVTEDSPTPKSKQYGKVKLWDVSTAHGLGEFRVG